MKRNKSKMNGKIEFYLSHYNFEFAEIKIINYTFKCKTLLIEAFTHKSFNETISNSNEHINSYDRLEILGDALLNFLVADYLY
jgi:dsRNA-specific ribonuclease